MKIKIALVLSVLLIFSGCNFFSGAKTSEVSQSESSASQSESDLPYNKTLSEYLQVVSKKSDIVSYYFTEQNNSSSSYDDYIEIDDSYPVYFDKFLSLLKEIEIKEKPKLIREEPDYYNTPKDSITLYCSLKGYNEIILVLSPDGKSNMIYSNYSDYSGDRYSAFDIGEDGYKKIKTTLQNIDKTVREDIDMSVVFDTLVSGDSFANAQLLIKLYNSSNFSLTVTGVTFEKVNEVGGVKPIGFDGKIDSDEITKPRANGGIVVSLADLEGGVQESAYNVIVTVTASNGKEKTFTDSFSILKNDFEDSFSSSSDDFDYDYYTQDENDNGIPDFLEEDNGAFQSEASI